MRALLLLATLLAWLAAPLAQAQPAPRRPVALSVEGVFGNETTLGDGFDAISVQATNQTTATLRGHVQITVVQYQQPEQVTRMPLDLPAGEARRAVVTVFCPDSASIRASYVADGGSVLAEASMSATYGQSARGLVVLADPPRLRGALLDMTTNVRAPNWGYAGGGMSASGVPLGIVGFDARTGDAIAPTSALGWSGIGVVAASIPALTRLSDEQRDALEGWIHAGGRVVLFPRTDADLSAPFVHAHFPELARGTRLERVDGQPPIAELTCGAAQRDHFGCIARAGFGAVYVADFDGAAPPYVELPTTRALVQSVVDQASGGLDPDMPALAFGRHVDETADNYGYYGSATRMSFGRLRAALDPNEGYRPALALVGVLLFFYVLAIGPLNFWLVGRRKTPTLALATTPAIAFACALLMFLVGYVGKGVLMRYRRVEIVETVSGDHVGLARRYTGFYFTRPTSMDVVSPEHGSIGRILGGSGGVLYQGDTSTTLRSASGGLWETIFTREEHVIDLSEGVSFVVDERRLASVVNRTGRPLRHAFVVDAQGRVYVVGDVASGSTVDIPRDSALYLPPNGYYDVSSSDVAALRDALGLGPGEEAYALGLQRLLATFPSGNVPVLYALTDPDPEPAATPAFTSERDLRILRVVAEMPSSPLYLPTGNIVELDDAAEPTPAAPADPMGSALQQFFGGGGTR